MNISRITLIHAVLLHGRHRTSIDAVDDVAISLSGPAPGLTVTSATDTVFIPWTNISFVTVAGGSHRIHLNTDSAESGKSAKNVKKR